MKMFLDAERVMRILRIFPIEVPNKSNEKAINIYGWFNST